MTNMSDVRLTIMLFSFNRILAAAVYLVAQRSKARLTRGVSSDAPYTPPIATTFRQSGRPFTAMARLKNARIGRSIAELGQPEIRGLAIAVSGAVEAGPSDR